MDRVLIIDDDHISNFLTKNVIRRNSQPQEITVCLDGQEAYDLLKETLAAKAPLPDLILLDINMPKMNGFDFLEAFREIKNCGPLPVIIILTTSDNIYDLEQLKNFPEVEVYLNKPLKEDSMHYILDKYFSSEKVSRP
jgi:CheY-like chemotaxis protein